MKRLLELSLYIQGNSGWSSICSVAWPALRLNFGIVSLWVRFRSFAWAPSLGRGAYRTETTVNRTLRSIWPTKDSDNDSLRGGNVVSVVYQTTKSHVTVGQIDLTASREACRHELVIAMTSHLLWANGFRFQPPICTFIMDRGANRKELVWAFALCEVFYRCLMINKNWSTKVTNLSILNKPSTSAMCHLDRPCARN